MPLQSSGLVAGQRQQRLSPTGQPVATHCLPPVQTLPQMPQLAIVSSLVQVGVPACVGQQSHGGETVVGHAVPQAPQLVFVLSGVHTPLQQSSLLAQILPQVPQLALSFFRSVHVPAQSSGLVDGQRQQWVCPLGQLPTWQVFPPRQSMPQAPQFGLAVSVTQA
jgi:hypothetical protein